MQAVFSHARPSNPECIPPSMLGTGATLQTPCWAKRCATSEQWPGRLSSTHCQPHQQRPESWRSREPGLHARGQPQTPAKASFAGTFVSRKPDGGLSLGLSTLPQLLHAEPGPKAGLTCV